MGWVSLVFVFTPVNGVGTLLKTGDPALATLQWPMARSTSVLVSKLPLCPYNRGLSCTPIVGVDISNIRIFDPGTYVAKHVYNLDVKQWRCCCCCCCCCCPYLGENLTFPVVADTCWVICTRNEMGSLVWVSSIPWNLLLVPSLK